MKFVFFGTPEFATIVLDKLVKSGYKPQAVFRNPKESIEILVSRLKNLKPDLAIIAAYGKILPKEVLEIPKHGFINIHGSILPKYRGPSPIQYAILNGDKETGVTIMKIDEKMDHGPILGKSKIRISKSETYESLSKKLAELGAELLIKILPNYISGKIKLVPQNHSKATYTKIIKKEDGKIDWKKSADEIERMTRGYYPWPSAWTTWNSKFLKILNTDVLPDINFTKSAIADFSEQLVGRVFLYNDNIAVKCGTNYLIIKKLQLEGGKILTAKEFINGHRDFIGSVLK
ncbi:MAG: methionyl-tRNA formyltransferase [Patescibacteria group bacterium]